MINIPVAFYNKTPEEMVDIWQQVSQHLDKSFTPIKSVRFLKKHFPKYHLYYTKDLFRKHSLNIPDIQLFNIAKQIQQQKDVHKWAGSPYLPAAPKLSLVPHASRSRTLSLVKAT